eukprot:CAMPEP_0115354352 /NCGR_PEP_ID=MMETSP0270-20121206/98535_1 /TAXON_ID=71861 /ORGANISM="Scrippsiella trochoidea, Strain CCMP3099" /LENGTH=177 /DNA_ID=CAMNT_0002776669 /DNA_START=47 /DNA_END=576 /DNA_ORIENTATION=+
MPEGDVVRWVAADVCDEDARVDVERIPLGDLPPLPRRARGYWTQPLGGVTIVVLLSSLFVGMVHAMVAPARERHGSSICATIALILVWSEAAIATISMMVILFGGVGVIRRSEKTCYPIPPQVEERLRNRRSLEDMINVSGAQGSQSWGSYCVRCLVWRPPGNTLMYMPHHCSVCSR